MIFFMSFIFVTLCQFYSVTSLVLFTKNSELCYERKRRFSVYMTASSHCVILKGVENPIFGQNSISRHICMYKQPILTK